MEKRNHVFKTVTGILANILLIAFIIILSGCSTDQPAATETPPQPTLDQDPTATSGPTLTPTPIPEPVTFEGSGNQIIDVPEELSLVGVFHAVHPGSGEFVIKGFDAFGGDTELFVDTTGPYDGKRLYFQYDPEKYPTRQLSVETNGVWELTLYPFVEEYITLVNLPGEYTGTGDDVIVVQPPGGSVEVSADGEGRFLLWAHHQGSKDLVIEETAPFSGAIALPYQTIILEVRAVGLYTLAITDQ